MTYTNYLRFYGLKDNIENHESWIANEFAHGRFYKYNGKFFNVKTGKEVK